MQALMPDTHTARDRRAEAVRRHLPPVPVPSLPELRLHLAGPRSGLGRLLAGERSGRPPYWAHVWSGGLGLARFILDHQDVVTGRRVLDLGCGSGLVAIAAARAGARDVLAVDIDPYAGSAAALNAALNGVAVAIEVADRLDDPVPPADVVLVGDLFYEASLAGRVTVFLDRAVAAGCRVLVGDPGRASLPLDRLVAIQTGPTPEFGQTTRRVACTVYRYAFPGDHTVTDACRHLAER